MTDPNAPLSLDLNDFCFIDTETKALPPTRGTPDERVTECGAYRYRRGARVIVITYAIGLGTVRTLAFSDFDITRKFVWETLPEDLKAFLIRAREGKAWFVAWNMAFDRLMLNTISGCSIEPRMCIDAMAQGLASNLPGKLEGASRFIGRHGKQQDGKNLINLFTGADGWSTVPEGATPQSHPLEWDRFKSYAAQDIDELRAVYRATRPLPRREWEEYWVSEKINDRGMMADVTFCERASAIAELNRGRMNAIVKRITGGIADRVTQRERIADYLFENTPHAEARDTLVKAWTSEDEIAGEDDERVPSKLSIAEDRLLAYINFYEALDENEGLTDEEADLLDLADARLTGASATPAKFQKIVDQNDEGRLCGQYTFNGAQQTGRFSSRGVQVHNLVRASLTDKAHPDREIEVIDLINQLEIEYV